MAAPQDHSNDMWVYNFQTKEPRQTINNVYEITKKKELVTFLHAAAGLSVLETWVQAIQNNQYATWPGIILALVYKKLSKLDETIKGHLKQQRQNV